MCLYTYALLRTHLFSVTVARVVLPQIRTRCLVNEIAFCLKGSVLQPYILSTLLLPLHGAKSPLHVWHEFGTEASTLCMTEDYGLPQAMFCPSLCSSWQVGQVLFTRNLHTQMPQQVTAVSQLVATEAAGLTACTWVSRRWQEPAKYLPSGEHLPEEYQ